MKKFRNEENKKNAFLPFCLLVYLLSASALLYEQINNVPMCQLRNEKMKKLKKIINNPNNKTIEQRCAKRLHLCSLF
jgi:hypothetical protein